MPIPGISAFAAQAKQRLNPAPGKLAMPDDHGHDETPKDAKAVAAATIKAVATGDIDPQIAKLMRGYSPDDEVPEWATDEELWQQAEAAIQPETRGKHLADPWLIVALTYKGLGGHVQPGGVQEPDGDEGESPEMPSDGDGDESSDEMMMGADEE